MEIEKQNCMNCAHHAYTKMVGGESVCTKYSDNGWTPPVYAPLRLADKHPESFFRVPEFCKKYKFWLD